MTFFGFYMPRRLKGERNEISLNKSNNPKIYLSKKKIFKIFLKC